MAVIPETILQRAIINGIRTLRSDDRLFNALFRNLTRPDQEGIRNTLLDNNVDFSINYPRNEPSLPAVILLLKSENESDGFLGDHMGTSYNYFVPDQDITYDTLGGHGASISTMSNLPRRVVGPLLVEESSGETTTNITIADESLDDWQEWYVENVGGAHPDYWDVYVVSGTGAGQKAQVEKIFATFLDIVGVLELDLDSTSVIELRLHDDPTLAAGEPARVYDINGAYSRKGAFYEVQYQLDILGGQQEQVIYLYYVLKAILISQRRFLEAQGIYGLTVSGSDFARRSEFVPDEVFQRNMTLSFKSEFSYLEVLPTYDTLIFNLCVDDQTSSVIASSTEFPISV